MSFAAVLDRLSKLENPFPGLRPFETKEAHLFFGRDQQVLDLLDRLARNRFVAVLGLSGSGKSSLVRAGLIPALAPQTSWRIAIVRPGGAPFQSIAAELNSKPDELKASSYGLINYAKAKLGPGEGLFILIDQFEELFRYKDKAGPQSEAAGEAAAFIELLMATARGLQPIYIVITMRTDYLGDCAEFPGFPETLNETQYLVPRLTREQRRQAIEGPLGRARISAGLVERILNDAGDEPDKLPILQHALMRTWSHWNGSDRPINIEDYDAIGGFQRALNQHADELMKSVEPKVAETIFKRLTALGRGNRERRDPAPLAELIELCGSDEGVRRVIGIFGQEEANFLTESGDYIDITHESLIRNWRVLAEQWLPEEERQSKTLIELADRAKGWLEGKKELLGGLDLSGAMEWDRQRNRSTKWAEHYAGVEVINEIEAFLLKSREKYEEMERQKRQQLLRSRMVSSILAILLTAAAWLAIIAWKQTRIAESREGAAQSEALLFQGQQVEAFATAIHSVSIEKTIQARDALAHAFPQELATLAGHSGKVLSADFSPDGHWVVTSSSDHTARVWNAWTGQPTVVLRGHTGSVLSAVFSRDGQRVTTASLDQTARVWNASTGLVIATLAGHTGAVLSADFSPDGDWVVTASADHTARVWNARTGRPTAILSGHSHEVVSAVFSPDGQRVVTESWDSQRVWNASTGQAIATLAGDTLPASTRFVSRDGKRMVSSGFGAPTRVWNTANGQLISELAGQSHGLSKIFSSPDGQRLITEGFDKIARVWNAATGQAISKLEGYGDLLDSAKFSPDGTLVLTTGYDDTVRVWVTSTGAEVAKLLGHRDALPFAAFSADGHRVVAASRDDDTAQIWSLALAGQLTASLNFDPVIALSGVFSSDGRRVVAASGNGEVAIFNAANGEEMVRLGDRLQALNAVFSPDGQLVVTANADHTAGVWDAKTGREIVKASGDSGTLSSVAFSPDSKRFVTAGEDHIGRVWIARTGQQIARLDGHSAAISGAVFSPDGNRVLTASADHTARVWNANTGQVIAILEGHLAAVNSAEFSPDGQLVVTASADNTARTWNASNGMMMAKLEGHAGAVTYGEFSRDGRRVITASNDHTARVWNAFTGELVAKLEGHSASVSSAAFSPDGHRALTASSDHTARVWNANTGQLLSSLTGYRHTHPVVRAAFSPDGHNVLTVGETVLIWHLVTTDDIGRLVSSQ